MALLKTELFIGEIYHSMPLYLYFPTDLPAEVGNKVKGVLTLYHGIFSTGEDWLTMTSAARYAADNGFILVIPQAYNSFYIDMLYGARFFTGLTKYLPRYLNAMFNIPENPEINYVAGSSAGGYGAVRSALTFPGRYAAAGCFSGVLDTLYMINFLNDNRSTRPLIMATVGSDIGALEGSDIDPFHLGRQVAKLPKEEQPRLFCTCGRQDRLIADIYAQNTRYREFAQEVGLDYTYREWDGDHDWNFWDRSLAEFFGFILNNDYGKRKASDWTAPIIKNTT